LSGLARLQLHSAEYWKQPLASLLPLPASWPEQRSR
jgi:hypothetical protein